MNVSMTVLFFVLEIVEYDSKYSLSHRPLGTENEKYLYQVDKLPLFLGKIIWKNWSTEYIYYRPTHCT